MKKALLRKLLESRNKTLDAKKQDNASKEKLTSNNASKRKKK